MKKIFSILLTVAIFLSYSTPAQSWDEWDIVGPSVCDCLSSQTFTIDLVNEPPQGESADFSFSVSGKGSISGSGISATFDPGKFVGTAEITVTSLAGPTEGESKSHTIEIKGAGCKDCTKEEKDFNEAKTARSNAEEGFIKAEKYLKELLKLIEARKQQVKDLLEIESALTVEFNKRDAYKKSIAEYLFKLNEKLKKLFSDHNKAEKAVAEAIAAKKSAEEYWSSEIEKANEKLKQAIINQAKVLALYGEASVKASLAENKYNFLKNDEAQKKEELKKKVERNKELAEKLKKLEKDIVTAKKNGDKIAEDLAKQAYLQADFEYKNNKNVIIPDLQAKLSKLTGDKKIALEDLKKATFDAEKAKKDLIPAHKLITDAQKNIDELLKKANGDIKTHLLIIQKLYDIDTKLIALYNQEIGKVQPALDELKKAETAFEKVKKLLENTKKIIKEVQEQLKNLEEVLLPDAQTDFNTAKQIFKDAKKVFKKADDALKQCKSTP